jgi:sugar phosphate isomerase/epimerase
MIKNLGLQLYTIRDYMRDPEFADVAFGKVAALGYTEAHTAGNAFDAKLFADLLAKHGIKIVGTHYDLNKILNDPEETIAHHKLWGTTTIGIGGMPYDVRSDLTKLREFIDQFNKAAEIYGKEGFRVSYHNHNFEFVRIDGNKTIMDLLYENLDPKNTSFVLDTCWVAAGGGDVRDWMEKLAGRIDILHLKDFTLKLEGGRFYPSICEVGYGNLSFDGIIETAERIGVKHYVVEQDTNWMGGNPFESLKMSAEFLAKYRK